MNRDHPSSPDGLRPSSSDGVRPSSLDGLRGLVGRRCPALGDRLDLRLVPGERGMEHVTLSAHGDVLRIEASSPSAAAVGLARALEDFFDADLSFDGPALIDASAALPDTPPQRVQTSLSTRYHLNPVTFGYTMAFWGWEDWERHIDWMALHGVTAPLNLVGHDAVLVAMLRDLGMEQEAAARLDRKSVV